MTPSPDKDKSQLGDSRLSRDIIASFRTPQKKRALLTLPSLHQKREGVKKNKRKEGNHPFKKIVTFSVCSGRALPTPLELPELPPPLLPLVGGGTVLATVAGGRGG